VLLPFGFRLWLLGFCYINGVVIYVYEKVVVHYVTVLQKERKDERKRAEKERRLLELRD